MDEERRHANDVLLAKLEAELRYIIRRQDAHERKLEEIDVQEKEEKRETLAFRSEMRDRLDLITKELTRYRGFIGGVMFMVAAVGAFLVYIKQWILAKLGIVVS